MTSFIFCIVLIFIAIASGFVTAALLNIGKEKPVSDSVYIQPLVYKWVLWNEEKMAATREGATAFLKKRLRENVEYRIEVELRNNGTDTYFQFIGYRSEILDYIKGMTSFFMNIKIFVRSDQIDEFEFKTAAELKNL